VSNWEHGSRDYGAAAHPTPQPYDAGPGEDDGSFEPVTYDQTDYRDLDAYLVHGGHLPDAWAEPGASRDDPGAWAGPAPRREGASRLRRLPAGARWRLAALTAVAAATLGVAVVIATGSTGPSLSPTAPPSSAPGGAALPGGPVSASSSAAARGAGPSPGPSRRAGLAAPAAGAPAALTPPITATRARQVVTGYTAANNAANAQASRPALAAVETGSSLAIDSGIYQGQRAGGSAPYPAYGPVAASYFIPLEQPAAYPHWFAVHVRNAFLSGSGKFINAEYLIFTQASPGAPWLEAMEPYIVNPRAEPAIALDANGFAAAVTPAGADLALPPSAASRITAGAFDHGGQPANPRNLAAGRKAAALRKQLPPGATFRISHSATTDPVFGLRTTSGGALLFYDIGATLAMRAPTGATLRLSVPGFVSPEHRAASVRLAFSEQLAVFDPAKGHGTAEPIVADYSGITG
jgi:hypothetical protein